MKIIVVDKPAQDSTTENPQIIDGKIYKWYVKSEKITAPETFQEWWRKKQEYIKMNPKYKNVTGIFLYDIIHLHSIEGMTSLPGMIVRYQLSEEI